MVVATVVVVMLAVPVAALTRIVLSPSAASSNMGRLSGSIGTAAKAALQRRVDPGGLQQPQQHKKRMAGKEKSVVHEGKVGALSATALINSHLLHNRWRCHSVPFVPMMMRPRLIAA